jgi:DNA-binding NtrC family response regulator
MMRSPEALALAIERAAVAAAPVLVRGEPGHARDLVARAIHAASDRRAGPFVKVSCGAIPVDRLEADIFGSERNGLEPASRRRFGRIEYARAGTICLDQAEALPRWLLARLLRAPGELAFSRLGGRERIHVDVRIVAATGQQPPAGEAPAGARPLIELRVPALSGPDADLLRQRFAIR